MNLKGRRVVITSGPTREHLDPVRFITNASSGRMGFALARAARGLGAEVVVVSGPTALKPPAGVSVVPVTTAQQMLRRVLPLARRADAFIGAAAVGDWRFARVSPRKLKKTGRGLTLRLVPNPDIIARLGRLRRRPFLVGFALETDRWLEHAQGKLRAKNLDLIVANRADSIGAESSRFALLWRDGRRRLLPAGAKDTAAREILRAVREALGGA